MDNLTMAKYLDEMIKYVRGLSFEEAEKKEKEFDLEELAKDIRMMNWDLFYNQDGVKFMPISELEETGYIKVPAKEVADYFDAVRENFNVQNVEEMYAYLAQTC